MNRWRQLGEIELGDQRRVATELELWQNDDEGHLIVIATFSVGRGGAGSVEEISVMMTDKRWLPYDGPVEHLLIESLVDQNRRFTKSLRYNLAADKPIATAVLTDTTPPTAMYVVTDDDEDSTTADLEELGQDTNTVTWSWKVTDPMPAIPAPGAVTAEPVVDAS